MLAATSPRIGRGVEFWRATYAKLSWIALRGAPSRAARRLIRGRKRLGFFDLHLDLAALERAGARLVAEHLGAALFTQVTLA